MNYKTLGVVNIFLGFVGALFTLYLLYILIFVIPQHVDWYVTNGLNIQTNLLGGYLMFVSAGLCTVINVFTGKKLIKEKNGKKKNKMFLYSSVTTLIGVLVLLLLYIGIISL